MARTTKQLSGGGKDKFLRAMIAADTGVAAEAVQRLGDQLAEAVTEVRVRRDIWEAVSKSQPAPARATTAIAANTSAPAFDPFAFSAVALFTKKGKAALEAALGQIASPDQLKALATAQHLAIDPALGEVATLRGAIVVAVERRIAERRAAAS